MPDTAGAQIETAIGFPPFAHHQFGIILSIVDGEPGFFVVDGQISPGVGEHMPLRFDEVPHVGAREGRGQHEVGQVRVQLQRQLDGLFHALLGLAGHAEDEKAHGLQARGFGPFERIAHLIQGLALADDMLQHPWIAIFHAEADPFRACGLHQMEQFGIGMVHLHAVHSDPGCGVQIFFHQRPA